MNAKMEIAKQRAERKENYLKRMGDVSSINHGDQAEVVIWSAPPPLKTPYSTYSSGMGSLLLHS